MRHQVHEVWPVMKANDGIPLNGRGRLWLPSGGLRRRAAEKIKASLKKKETDDKNKATENKGTPPPAAAKKKKNKQHPATRSSPGTHRQDYLEPNIFIHCPDSLLWRRVCIWR
ncbi:hypothetical protein NDU88_005773 [Pleurodeles waltl]|uniref:Uncharacterized protein n=1 Tax=Pleurodeles waltl TaxID=8319 RepID=A0AAV7TD71_PLEWA|nr:hypothetical protein NDU88_005773 [Pleurodeles waltl]